MFSTLQTVTGPTGSELGYRFWREYRFGCFTSTFSVAIILQVGEGRSKDCSIDHVVLLHFDEIAICRFFNQDSLLQHSSLMETEGNRIGRTLFRKYQNATMCPPFKPLTASERRIRQHFSQQASLLVQSPMNNSPSGLSLMDLEG